MPKIVDAQQVLDKLMRTNPRDREKITIHASRSRFDEFRATVEKLGFSASEVLEEMMQQFVEGLKAPL